MKTAVHLLLLITVITVTPSNAQWEISLVGGAGTGRMRTDLHPATDRGERQEMDWRFSWTFGCRVSQKMPRPFRFNTGAYWCYIAGHDEYWSQDMKIQETDRQVHYLALPMLLSVQFGHFSFGAGYQLAIPVLEAGIFRGYPYANGLGNTSVFETRDLGLRSTDMGIVLEAGARLCERIDLIARFYHGFQDIKYHNDGFLSPLMNQQLLLAISYRILPWRRPQKIEDPTGPSPEGTEIK